MLDMNVCTVPSGETVEKAYRAPMGEEENSARGSVVVWDGLFDVLLL